jgi:DGQHR domain-containing protein
MKNNNVEIQCIEVVQPIGRLYVGKISWSDLLAISYSDIRRIQSEEEGTIESYLGIQRELSQGRLKEIANYVSYSDATFPTSIVLSINSVNEISDKRNIVSYDKEKGLLILERDPYIAQIIDGQHRVFGIKKYSESIPLLSELFQFDLIVTIFIDIDPDEESMIFSTINKAQTKVNQSLVYDLYDLAKSRSPQKSAHNIVKLLDEKDGSPLKGMIKRLGKADDPLRETITQATLVECIIAYISKPNEELKDRDILKKGLKLEIVTQRELQRLFFRNWFILEKDEKIARVLWNYFAAIKRRWNNAWNEQSILVKSTGVIAFMKFLLPIVQSLGIEKIITEDDFFAVFEKININDEDFNKEKYIPGQSGISQLVKELKAKSNL